MEAGNLKPKTPNAVGRREPFHVGLDHVTRSCFLGGDFLIDHLAGRFSVR